MSELIEFGERLISHYKKFGIDDNVIKSKTIVSVTH